jgi:hypothetical protein
MVRESLVEFVKTVRFRRREVLRLFIDNHVCYYDISILVSVSPNNL